MTELVPTGDDAAADVDVVDHVLSESTIQRLREAMTANTARAYGRIWDGRASPDAELPNPPGGFMGWCLRTGRSPLPATKETFAEYVSHLCDEGKSPATIEQAISAIRTAHTTLGFKGLPDAVDARKVLRAHKRRRAQAGLGRQRKSAPVIVDNLRRMVDTLDDNSPQGMRDHALLLLGIVLFGRRSEIVALDWSDIVKAPEGLMVTIRMSKTDQEAQGATVPVLYGAFPRTDPVRVLNRWRAFLAEQGLDDGPVLRAVDRHGNVGDRLTPQSVNLIVRRLAKAAKLDNADSYTAHSLRAGAATVAYMNGAPISTICDIGRWKPGSPVVLGYIRSVDQWKNHPLRGVL